MQGDQKGMATTNSIQAVCDSFVQRLAMHPLFRMRLQEAFHGRDIMYATWYSGLNGIAVGLCHLGQSLLVRFGCMYAVDKDIRRINL